MKEELEKKILKGVERALTVNEDRYSTFKVNKEGLKSDIYILVYKVISNAKKEAIQESICKLGYSDSLGSLKCPRCGSHKFVCYDCLNKN